MITTKSQIQKPPLRQTPAQSLPSLSHSLHLPQQKYSKAHTISLASALLGTENARAEVPSLTLLVSPQNDF